MSFNSATIIQENINKPNINKGLIYSSSIDGSSKIWSLSSSLCTYKISNDDYPIFSQEYIRNHNCNDSLILLNKGNKAQLRYCSNIHESLDLIDINDNKVYEQKFNDQNRILQTQKGHLAKINAVINHKDLIITGSNDSTIQIQDKLSGKSIRVLKGHIRAVTCLKIINQNGMTILISGSTDATIKLWNLNSGKLLHTQRNHRGSITSIAISYENIFELDDKLVSPLILSGSEDGQAELWRPFENNPVSTQTGHTSAITAVQSDIFDKSVISECKIYTGSDDCLVKVWSQAGECLNTIQFEFEVKSLYVTEGMLLIVGLENGEIVTQDLIEDNYIDKYKIHDKSITSLYAELNTNTNENENGKTKGIQKVLDFIKGIGINKQIHKKITNQISNTKKIENLDQDYIEKANSAEWAKNRLYNSGNENIYYQMLKKRKGQYQDDIKEEDSDNNVKQEEKLTPIIKILFDYYYRDIRKQQTSKLEQGDQLIGIKKKRYGQENTEQDDKVKRIQQDTLKPQENTEQDDKVKRIQQDTLKPQDKLQQDTLKPQDKHIDQN